MEPVTETQTVVDSLEGAPAAASKRSRRVNIPVPAALVGQQATGVISDTLETRHGDRFGFINVTSYASEEAAPRIYFSNKFFTNEENFVPRRGYEVSFLITQDDAERASAIDVVLTEAGKAAAVVREAQREAQGENKKSDKPARKRSPRAPREVDPRSWVFKVTGLDGTDTGNEVTGRMDEGFGKLKHHCMVAADTEDFELQVFHADGRILTKDIMATMTDGDVIKLGPKPAEEATQPEA